MNTVAFPAARPALSQWAFANPVAPPSSRVIASVLQFGDIWQTREDGTTLIRFSDARLEQDDMKLLLDDERQRAADISLIWDDQEEQLLQVLDGGGLRQPPAAPGGPTGNSYADTRMRGFPRHEPYADHARAA
jgi:hypothetical protein